ncbi:Cytochrome b-c1 complex subunit 8 [Echinococcus granulosus]|uniref:Cytochrome b-c1 complex subunit 8 n=2 Tax=Echinococcus TaxID=6209 RepID=U6IX74_ECHGR|nr:Cytochrome b-c1 complex subunit [Echinococcus granulosus]EUB57068.1 Cytochrome b-c1 complex subunit [Echinococcus granulosus]KAH9285903.1 Cytochrome b-c1 complex subunit 8 [Echinococcus granulosus]CDS16384.1 ubiquinol cytochrome c reductase complex III [Echinococcus granulosus]CDS41181.1 ubiquinol cytochrome c reductase complex III [Echinococcus multilocularis]
MRFGELHYRRGVITYSISPYEVNAFKGFFSQGFPNFVRRFREKFLVVASPFIFTFSIIYWANVENARSKRKAYLQKKN